MTALVFDQYLPHFRELLFAELFGQFLHDNLTLHGEQSKRGMMLMAGKMENLCLADVRLLYNLPAVPDEAR